jgi:hypothetical protein
MLVKGKVSRELRRAASGGADADWTVAEGHVFHVEAGLFIPVDDCLSNTSTPWPDLPPSKEDVAEQHTLNQLKRKLEETTALAKVAKQKLDQDKECLDNMLQNAKSEAEALELQAGL